MLINSSEKGCLGMMINSSDVIGLIPAAGYAKRISPLPCSKEIYPIKSADGTSKVAASYLLESFKQANIEQIYLILRTGKWDIPEYFKNGESVSSNLAYIVSKATGGVPQTIDKAYPFIKKNRVAFGFPDILFNSSNVFLSLLEKQTNTGADLVLGLFNASNPEKMDMVDFDSQGKLKNIIIKPRKTDLSHTWIIAVWSPVFSRFLHEYVARFEKTNKELHIGEVFRQAIQTGLETGYVKFNGSYIDIGTPSEFKKVNNMEWIRKFESDDQLS
jgi:glucose-1-phosphate thymidylyltransferase